MPSPLPGAVSRTKHLQTFLTGEEVYVLRKKRGWWLREFSELIDRRHLECYFRAGIVIAGR